MPNVMAVPDFSSAETDWVNVTDVGVTAPT
jgi:hypothetical protein